MKGLMHAHVLIWGFNCSFFLGGHIWITRQASGVGMKRNSLLKSATCFCGRCGSQKGFCLRGSVWKHARLLLNHVFSFETIMFRNCSWHQKQRHLLSSNGRNVTLEKEIFPAATDSRFIRAVSTNHPNGPICYSPSVLCHVIAFRLASLPSDFPRWTTRRSCCTTTTSSWTSKSSWGASAYTRGWSPSWPAFHPVPVKRRCVPSERLHIIICNISRDHQREKTWIFYFRPST